jgi:undecaprenyl diphosphate synthase
MKALFDTLTPGEEAWELATSLDPDRLPAHIAVIMDGNGRWARRRGLPRVAGHRAGVEPVRVTVEACARLGIEALTLYAFSIENWKRPETEVEALWHLLRLYIQKEMPLLVEHGIRLTAIGRLDKLPAQVRRDLTVAMKRTAKGAGLRLNVAINYGGRAEIVDAVNHLIERARRDGALDRLRLDESKIASALYTAGLPDPDLLIRTSGEMRVSNFLLWQIAYAELYVTDTLWPDFRLPDLLRAILEYQRRNRRFGGIDPVKASREEHLVDAVPVNAR